MKGGDGMLVDDRDGGATAAMNGNGEIDGRRLFGDEGGKFGNGFDKLRQLDRDGDGKLTGAELEGLKVWVDNGDARVGGVAGLYEGGGAGVERARHGDCDFRDPAVELVEDEEGAVC